MGKFAYLISPFDHANPVITTELFDIDFEHSTHSALDDFIEKRKSLFTLFRPYESDITQVPNELINMILLGCISAVESFIRKLIRSIVILDESSRKKCEEIELQYGAVLSHKDSNMLPEAILEKFSFASGKNIKDTVSKVLGLNCDTPALKKVFEEFTKICELRHCVVHRFGLLGSKNAIKLGLDDHIRFLEKPMQINFDQLNQIVLVCENLVKALNNYLFSEVLERTFRDKTELWYFDFRRDKKIFQKYYKLFRDSTNTEKDIEIYRKFIKCMEVEYGKGYQNGHPS